MSIVISIANQKGGVSKTTTASLLAVGLDRMGFRVLAFDADAQGNMSTALHADKSDDAFCLADLMEHIQVVDDNGKKRQICIGDVIQHAEYCDVIASNSRTAKAAENFTEEDRLYFLSELMDELRPLYDFVILDTGPAKDLMIKNCLVASDGVIIPVIPAEYAMEGVEAMAETLNQARRKKLNPGLKFYGILMTKYQANYTSSKEFLPLADEFAEAMNGKLFQSVIRIDENVNKSQAASVPEEKKRFAGQKGIILYDYSPNTHAVEDYKAFISELLHDLEMEVPNAH